MHYRCTSCSKCRRPHTPTAACASAQSGLSAKQCRSISMHVCTHMHTAPYNLSMVPKCHSMFAMRSLPPTKFDRQHAQQARNDLPAGQHIARLAMHRSMLTMIQVNCTCAQCLRLAAPAMQRAWQPSATRPPHVLGYTIDLRHN